ncbi:hypothetical protein BC834DRAFT_913499 [Gloeopeniophorella convolvens]|nr:hypothetical protein BC834DRAFT_913499 [Gloeopeniophorella convolvens]
MGDPTIARVSAEAWYGILLIAILINTLLYGIITQQFAAYWDSSTYLWPMVSSSVVLISLEGVVNLVNTQFVGFAVPPWPLLFAPIGNGAIVYLANVFLCFRIYHLTRSKLQSGAALFVSTSAFILAIVNFVIIWKVKPNTIVGHSGIRMRTIVWHVLQIIADILIMILLTRALLKSRSGMRKSDSLVYHFIRSAVQTGCLATVWTLAETVAWTAYLDTAVYSLFEFTMGTMYTYGIFDTLLSRVRLRERLDEPSALEMDLRGQAPRAVEPVERMATGTISTFRIDAVTAVSFVSGSNTEVVANSLSERSKLDPSVTIGDDGASADALACVPIADAVTVANFEPSRHSVA